MIEKYLLYFIGYTLVGLVSSILFALTYFLINREKGKFTDHQIAGSAPMIIIIYGLVWPFTWIYMFLLPVKEKLEEHKI